MTTSTPSRCPFHAIFPPEASGNLLGAISSRELREYMQTMVSALASKRVSASPQSDELKKLKAAIPLLDHLQSHFGEKQYILGKMSIYDLASDIERLRPGVPNHYELSNLGRDIYIAITTHSFGNSRVHDKSESVMMLAISPIDSYIIDVLYKITSEAEFDEEMQIARQNIILMASLNGAADHMLHRFRRMNGSGLGRFDLQYLPPNDEKYYIQCIGITSGYLTALLNAIIPIYRTKYLAQAIERNMGLVS